MTGAVAIASMFVGGMVYVLWRPDSLMMFSWFSALGLGQPIDAMRAWAGPYAGVLPDWLRFSAPQALWVLSGCLAIHTVWRDASCRQEQFWMGAVTVLAVGGELGQAAGFVKGSFDPLDFALVALAFVAAQIIALGDHQCRRTERVCP